MNPPPPAPKCFRTLFLRSCRNVPFGAVSVPSVLGTNCGISQRIVWVVEQFWRLFPFHGQLNTFSVGATRRIIITARGVRNPENRGMRVHLSVPCLLTVDLKTEFCYMCRTNKSADRYCLCQSLTLKHLTIKLSSQYSNVTTKWLKKCVISDFHCEINQNCKSTWFYLSTLKWELCSYGLSFSVWCYKLVI